MYNCTHVMLLFNLSSLTVSLSVPVKAFLLTFCVSVCIVCVFNFFVKFSYNILRVAISKDTMKAYFC